eukprot:762775-Hanusia_phi.AAC.1
MKRQRYSSTLTQQMLQVGGSLSGPGRAPPGGTRVVRARLSGGRARYTGAGPNQIPSSVLA